LQSYSLCSLAEFKDEFTRYSLIKVDFDDIDAQFYQNMIRAAYIAGRGEVGGYYLLDSLMGVHDYHVSEEFVKKPNILFTPLPFKMILPLYWYTVRKFLLTNTSSQL
jgi:hypothetical protein